METYKYYSVDTISKLDWLLCLVSANLNLAWTPRRQSDDWQYLINDYKQNHNKKKINILNDVYEH